MIKPEFKFGPYKEYESEASYDPTTKCFHGHVTNTKDIITFKYHPSWYIRTFRDMYLGSIYKIETAFKESVDDYLSFCEEKNQKPNKPIKEQNGQ